MAAAGYENITVRMLLNHSSGFPGTDDRNCVTGSPVPGYLDQVLQTLSMSRLKAPPGYMSVYCNDGFTITAALVETMSGKSYVRVRYLAVIGIDHHSRLCECIRD
jgi:CubicO group peptidase (beta-lactamase class C family)